MDSKYLKKVLLIVVVLTIVVSLVLSMMHVYFASSEKELVLRFPTVETVYESLNCPALILFF